MGRGMQGQHSNRLEAPARGVLTFVAGRVVRLESFATRDVGLKGGSLISDRDERVRGENHGETRRAKGAGNRCQ